jgi:putative tryptophan/tyrosine transport system substrate-binding protein
MAARATQRQPSMSSPIPLGTHRAVRRRSLLAAAASAATGLAWAQQRVWRVGVLSWNHAGPYHEATSKGLAAGLADQGFVVGRNLQMLQRAAEFDAAQFGPLARELARVPVDAFFAPATPMATAAWRADRRIPIVIATILDPVELDFAKSLARPGTRVTGVTTMNQELTGKRMELLARAVPGLKRVGVIVDSAMRDACEQEIDALHAAARQLGLVLQPVTVASGDQLAAAFEQLSSARVQAVMTTLTSTRNGLEREYALAALQARLPSMSEFDYGTRLGALLSYGPDLGALFRRAGQMLGRVLQGEDPAGMPIEQPTRFRLSVNRGTAQALGLTLPPSLLALVDDWVD